MNDGSPWLFSGDDSGNVKFWNLTNHELMKTLQDISTPALSLAAFNVDGKPNLAVGCNDIDLWHE